MMAAQNGKTKTLVLDESKWICGMPGTEGSKPENSRGIGDTLLCNDNYKMCCLGQFALQLNPDLTENNLLGLGEPYEIDTEVDLLVNGDSTDGFANSHLSGDAISINDDINTTVETKVELLKKLFAKEGIEIIFKPQENVESVNT